MFNNCAFITGSVDRTIGSQRHRVSIRVTVMPVEDGGPVRDVEYAKTVNADEQMLGAVTQGILQACSKGYFSIQCPPLMSLQSFIPVGPLLSFPIINAKITIEQLLFTLGSSPAMGQNCAIECMTEVRPKPHSPSCIGAVEGVSL